MTHKNYKILLIDDDKFLLGMYSQKFAKEGFEVVSAPSGTEAFAKLQDFKPDIVLSDIVLPGLDGLDIIEHIQKEKLAEGAIIIMLTNQGDKYDIDRAKALHVHGYIVKATSIPSEVVTEVVKIAEQNGK